MKSESVENAKLHLAYAHDNIATQRHKWAIRDFDRAIKCNPESLNAYTGRIYCKVLILPNISDEEQPLALEDIIKDLQTALKIAMSVNDSNNTEI